MMTENQKCILQLLLKRHDTSCDYAGVVLQRAGLLKKTSSYASNLCLPGSAVLRSLEKQGLLHRYSSSRDRWAISLYCLSPKGREVAEKLREAVEKLGK